MGLCSSCFKGSSVEEVTLQPSMEVRRKLQQEAAEKRRIESEHRGIKDPGKIRMQQERAAELSRREQEASRMSGNAALKWQAD